MANMAGIRFWRRIGACVVLLALAACGDNVMKDSTPDPTSAGDPRNGEYIALAANARDYVLTLDFVARTYRISGNGLEQSGAIGGTGGDVSGFFFVPAGGAATVVNTARFFQLDDTVVGGFRFPEGVLPFVAPRSFVSKLSDAAGVYNVLTRGVDTAAAASNTIFQAELTSTGLLRTCNDLQILSIAACPATSVTTGTVTIAGNVFTSTTPTGAFPFRIARIGADKVLLRASPSSTTARRFWVGVPATAAFASGSFAAVDTDGNFSSLTLSATAHGATVSTPSGTSFARSGGAQPVGPGGLASLLALTTASSGSFFALRSADLALVVSTLGSTAAPGFMAIGKRQ
jgi:hypothetical protein